MSRVSIHRHEVAATAGNAVTYVMAPNAERNFPIIASMTLDEFADLRDAMMAFEDDELRPIVVPEEPSDEEQ